MSRRRNRVKTLRINRLRLNGGPSVSPMDEGDSESVVSSTTDAEPRKVKPLIIKRTWTKIEPPTAGSPPTIVLRSIPGGNQGSRKYNVEVAKLLLRLNTSASTKDGDEPTCERAVTSSSTSSKDDDSSQTETDNMSSDVDENYLANDEDSMTENEGIDEKVQLPAHPGICEVCQAQLTLGGGGTRRTSPPVVLGHGPSSPPRQLFKCNRCGRDFSRRGNLVIHLRVHNERHLYECSDEFCQKSFRCIGELRAHERSHMFPSRDLADLRVSPARGPGDRIALRIFKAGSRRTEESPLNNQSDLKNHVVQGVSDPRGRQNRPDDPLGLN